MVDRHREALLEIVRVRYLTSEGDLLSRADRMYRLAVEALCEGKPVPILDHECPRSDSRDDYLGITAREEPPTS